MLISPFTWRKRSNRRPAQKPERWSLEPEACSLNKESASKLISPHFGVDFRSRIWSKNSFHSYESWIS